MVIPCNFPDALTCPAASACDVHFVVGPDGDTWTISGRRELLRRASETLAVIMRDAGDTIRITGVDKRGFEHLLRHLEGSEIKFTSVQTTRTTLDVACKFQCLSLVKLCIKHLDVSLDTNNVLLVYKNLASYCNNSHTCEPCAPAFDAATPSDTATQITEWCSGLLHNCLLLIEDNACDVLTREEFEFLDFRDMSTIVSRESLQIKDELILFDCLMRWFRCECKRLGNIPVNPTTRQEIIGDLIYKVRFGLLNRNVFMHLPGKAGVLTPNEVNEILVVIDLPASSVNVGLLRHCNVKRMKSNVEPKYLSSRTEPVTSAKNKKLKIKKDKSKALLNCLTVWTVLFD